LLLFFVVVFCFFFVGTNIAASSQALRLRYSKQYTHGHVNSVDSSFACYFHSVIQLCWIFCNETLKLLSS
jgi:hypothetical protein